MAKDTFYFSHDYNARNDEKILELRVVFGAEGYGVFWMIVENMAENENGGLNTNLMGGLSLSYGLPIGKLREFITFCISIDLFYEEGTFLFSKRLKKHKELRLKLVETGKESANKRWKNGLPTNNPLTTHLVPNGLSMQRKGKERKEKEIKEKELIKINIPKKKFNTRPLPEHFNGLPENYVNQSIELVCITKSKNIDYDTVKRMWEIFKVQNLTGDDYFANEGKVYSYFINWIKKQDFLSSDLGIIKKQKTQEDCQKEMEEWLKED